MATSTVNPAKAWPTAWGKEAQKWASDLLRYKRTDFTDRLDYMRFCMSTTQGMINPKVPSDAWDEYHKDWQK